MDCREFFIQYWYLLLSCVLFIASFICSLIKKKSSSDLMSKLFLDVVNLIPILISQVEEPGNGEKKKIAVLSLAIKSFESSLGRSLTDDELVYYTSLLNKEIENILCTPQKKGV